jgi:hypothetical protein
LKYIEKEVEMKTNKYMRGSSYREYDGEIGVGPQQGYLVQDKNIFVT